MELTKQRERGGNRVYRGNTMCKGRVGKVSMEHQDQRAIQYHWSTECDVGDDWNLRLEW